MDWGPSPPLASAVTLASFSLKAGCEKECIWSSMLGLVLACGAGFYVEKEAQPWASSQLSSMSISSSLYLYLIC